MSRRPIDVLNVQSGQSAVGKSSSRNDSGNGSFIRDDWIGKQMRALSKEFTQHKPLTIFCGTWNVNAKKPGDSLRSWLSLGSDSAVQCTTDIVVAGFQEIVDLNATNLLVEHKASQPWEEQLQQCLGNDYVQIAGKHMVGVLLTVFVRRAHLSAVSSVQVDTAGVGIMGVGGNKGGVGIRFRLYDSSLCFVNAHLAAHKNNVQGRNSDWENVCARLAFQADSDHKNSQLTDGIQSVAHGQGDQDQANESENKCSIFDHDFLFWCGDLNYRLNATDLDHVHQRVAAGDWPYLLSQDQLNVERAAGNTFRGFQEGQIDFAPTYKYQPGTNVYERRPDKKTRFPAWCDRVLWHDQESHPVQLKHYGSTSDQCCSDHKPVGALFGVSVDCIVAEKQRQVYRKLLRQLDQWDNQAKPQVSVLPAEVSFDRVRYAGPVRRTLTLTNTGNTLAKFRFVPRPAEHKLCAPWLSVQPQFGIILPGEKADVQLVCSVHADSVASVSGCSLEDILICRVDNGGDYFVPVQGQYLRSCFGCTAEFLVKVQGPIREHSETSEKVESVLSMPKELWRVVDHIFRFGMDESGLFLTSGLPGEIEAIRECLDTGAEFSREFSIHSMAETLIRFLESLAVPIFPPSLCSQYQEGMNLTAWCRQALMHLPLAHYNTFIYMVAFLREVLKHRANNDLVADKLVLVFASGLMHASPAQVENDDKPWQILRHFLTTNVI